MTRTALGFANKADVRAAERRLTAAVGASLVIHALAIAALTGVVVPLPARAPGLVNQLGTIQAVLAGPRIEIDATDLAPLDLSTVPKLFTPPLEEPVEIQPRRPSHQAPAPSPGAVARASVDNRPVSIAIKPVDDPSRLGPAYALSLAQQFPRRASKAATLLGSPAVLYPRGALEAGINGRIAALVTLDAGGHVVDSTLLPEDGLFAPAVADALKTAQFAPAEIDGKPVPYWAIVEFYFNIARPLR